jgi:DNA-binding XRE family transcriptional regulator
VSSPFKTWMLAASPATQTRLAKAVGTSRQYLYHWANGHRVPEPETAAAIERETRKISEESGGIMPIVWRVDTNPACAKCEFAARCMSGVPR